MVVEDRHIDELARLHAGERGANSLEHAHQKTHGCIDGGSLGDRPSGFAISERRGRRWFFFALE
jgi:hypothetical protein